MEMAEEKKRWVQLVLCLVIPLFTGGIAALLSMEGMKRFESMAKPPLTPPDWVFAVVWTTLYLMMGYASYLVWRYGAPKKRLNRALVWYGAQLAANLVWSPLFFRWEMHLASLIWLVLLLGLAIITAGCFRKLVRKAGCWMLPYLGWLLFAGYLNAGVWILNR